MRCLAAARPGAAIRLSLNFGYFGYEAGDGSAIRPACGRSRRHDCFAGSPYGAKTQPTVIVALQSKMSAEARGGQQISGEGNADRDLFDDGSLPDDAPRGLEFLLSANRLNVATSRARCAVVVVGSPKLMGTECRSPRQMKLVNATCRYGELAARLL